MNESLTVSQSTILTQRDAALLLGIAGRCRDGLTTVADADVLEGLAHQVAANDGKQIQKQNADLVMALILF